MFSGLIAAAVLMVGAATCHSKALDLVGEASRSKKGEWFFRPTKPDIAGGKNFKLLHFPIPTFTGTFIYVRIEATAAPCAGQIPCLTVQRYTPEFYDPLQNLPATKR